ncbi:hypothetical protein ABZ897_30185 [Nonomuraea sp. NPDC046802]|uniref:hypothetical protein n=1 Tax=Nonomuraea sp. NPDC046802 TaxID=3154919 RepID=UPI0033D4AD0A
MNDSVLSDLATSLWSALSHGDLDEPGPRADLGGPEPHAVLDAAGHRAGPGGPGPSGSFGGPGSDGGERSVRVRGEQVGDESAQSLGLLWARLRARRERRGHHGLPANREELYLSLLELLLDDSVACELVMRISVPADQ